MAENQDTLQEKTEPATPKKKQESRNKGKTAKSIEINSAFLLMFGILILYFAGAAIASHVSTFAQRMFIASSTFEVTQTNVHHIFIEAITVIGAVVLPVAIGLLFVGLAASYTQVGFLFTLEPMKPKFSKLNPLTGFKKVIFSRRALAELVKNLFKVGIIALVAYVSIKNVLAGSLDLMDSDVGQVVMFMLQSSFAVALKVGIAFLVMAIFDYVYQRFEYERDLRMTKQEIKDENKITEGDPLIKSRIRSIQKQIAYKRMMQDVQDADVVVTNPKHLAVALKYDQDKMNAPKVIAKGAELIAQRIKEIASEHDIPIVEDKFLARALFKTVEVGEEIPEKLFQAVAQVLAYIYRIKNKTVHETNG